MKEIKNTLEGFQDNYQRRSGNSTKQIDIAIDLLFKGYIVEIKDHWEYGGHRKANENLFQRVLRRLQFEHQLDAKEVKINKSKLTIELL